MCDACRNSRRDIPASCRAADAEAFARLRLAPGGWAAQSRSGRSQREKMQTSESSYDWEPLKPSCRERAELLAQSLQICHQIVDVGVGVFVEQFNMGIRGRVDLVLHITGPPGSIRTCGIDESDGKLIEVFQGAGDGLPGSQGYRDRGFRVPGIEHLHFEFKAPVA